MTATPHLKALQALELAVREGSLKGAADKLGITPAAVGQRIRTLEDFLSTDLLMRGRSGLQPTKVLDAALADLRIAFEALERATETLDFQRVSEIHIVAEPDWSELWLLPRLQHFRDAHPNLKFCINGDGDVPMRLGSPDLRIFADSTGGELLYNDILVPVTGPDNTRRIADFDPVNQMEGMPLLHLRAQANGDKHPGWVEWFQTYGHRERGPDRGVNYPNARIALDAVRQNVGFLVCNLSLILNDLKDGTIVTPFPLRQHLADPQPLRLSLRSDASNRAPIMRFVEWLRKEARDTAAAIEAARRRD